MGGILGSARFGIMQYAPVDVKNKRQASVVAQPTVEDAALDLRFYFDHGASPENYAEYTDDGLGVTTEKGKPDATMSLKRSRARGATWAGRAHKRMDGLVNDRHDDGRFIQPEIRFVQGMDRVKVYEVVLEGVVAE